ncbi:MAG: signal peptidase II [Candidatus Hydrogenedentota bacterium]|nr:MAG: signal peptidase II [Candidatus Hydrogenedentota bacterium]
MTNPTASHVPASALRFPHLLSIAFLITLIDQVTKWIVISHLHLHESVPVVPGIFSVTRVHNSGIAFGLFPGLPDVFMVITLISMLFVIYFYLTSESRGTLLTLGCAFILGGAMGNLLDRFRFGYVVDFVNFSFWPAFNVADASVSIGVALLLTSFFRGRRGMSEDASDSV